MKFQKTYLTLLALLFLSKGALAAEPVAVATCPSSSEFFAFTQKIYNENKLQKPPLDFQLPSVTTLTEPKFKEVTLSAHRFRTMTCVYQDSGKEMTLSATIPMEYSYSTCYLNTKGNYKCNGNAEDCILYCMERAKEIPNLNSM